MSVGIYVKYPSFVSSLTCREYSLQIFKKYSWKSTQWGPSYFMWTDGRTDGQTGRHGKAK